MSWKVAYQGKMDYCQIPNLKPNSIYNLRIQLENSEYSPILKFNTLSDGELAQYSINNTRMFKIDCVNDIVVGDVIYFIDEIPHETAIIEREVNNFFILDNR